MFIKRKSANLFKKSATLSLMKLKDAALEAANAHADKKPVAPKKTKKVTVTTTNEETGEQ